MPKRLVVIALAAASSLAALFVALDWPLMEAGAGCTAEGAAPDTTTGSAELVEPDRAARAVEDGAGLAASTETRTRAATEADAYEEELAKGRWVAGRVVFPAGTPVDEQVFLIAKGRDFEYGPEHRLEVESDGSFRLAFSERTRKGWIRLEARYLYLEEAPRVEFDEDFGPLVLEPLLGGRILGEIVLQAGGELSIKDLDGARVELVRTTTTSVEMPRIARVEGPVFQFPALVPAKDYWARLDAERAYAVPVRDVAVRAGETTELRLEARRGVAVEGRVVDERGEPMGGIEVDVHSTDQGRGLFGWREATTGSDGTYRVQGLPPGTVNVQVKPAEFEPAERELFAPEDAELMRCDLVLARGLAIAGTVRWPDGTPAAEATVQISDPDFDSRSVVTTASDGSFVANGLSDASYKVEARGRLEEDGRETSAITGRKRTRREHAIWRAIAEKVPAGTTELDLVLDPGMLLAGFVLDDLGRPLDAFEVEALPKEGPDSFQWHFLPHGGTRLNESFRGAAGRFELRGFTPGAWSVAAKANGHAVSSARVLQVPDDLREPIELVAPRLGRIEGVVVDPSGRGVGDAQVVRTQQNAFLILDQFLDREPVTTDGAGRFVFENVAPGSVAIHATSGVAAPSESVAVELDPGGLVTGVELVLRLGGRITGQVVDAGGVGLPSRQVTLFGVAHCETTSDASGNFAFENVPAGQHHLFCIATAEEIAALAIPESQVADGILARRVTVELEERGSANVVLAPPVLRPVLLHGRVTASGKPLANASISCGREHAYTSVQADGDGAYELVLPAPGSYSVRVNSDRINFEWALEVDVPEVARFLLDVEIVTGGQ